LLKITFVAQAAACALSFPLTAQSQTHDNHVL
jgi:hypothetical protein